MYGVSEGEALCDWIYESCDEPRSFGAKIQNLVWQIPPDVPWGGDVKMRWLTNFYDFRFKWTATAGIGIHPTKAWLSQLVNFKNAIWSWGHFRRTICNKIEGYAIKLEKVTCDKSCIYCYDQETEYPVEACWLFQNQEGQTEKIHP